MMISEKEMAHRFKEMRALKEDEHVTTLGSSKISVSCNDTEATPSGPQLKRKKVRNDKETAPTSLVVPI